MLESEIEGRFAVAAHSYAEAFVTLTRRTANATFLRNPEDAWLALESVARVTRLVGLTPAQSFAAIRSYAGSGGIGARLYDRLVGQVAVEHGIPRIITWNVRHMQSLFPRLEIIDPAAFLNAGAERR